jgi:hypothetical protein
MDQNVSKVGLFGQQLLDIVDLSLGNKQFLLKRLFLIRKRMNIFVNLLNFYIDIFLHSSHHFILNGFRKLLDHCVEILYFLDSAGDFRVYL